MKSLDNLRQTMRRDRVFDFMLDKTRPIMPGTRPVKEGEVDVTHGPILYLENVSVSFDGFKAINDLTLYINDGEFKSEQHF